MLCKRSVHALMSGLNNLAARLWLERPSAPRAKLAPRRSGYQLNLSLENMLMTLPEPKLRSTSKSPRAPTAFQISCRSSSSPEPPLVLNPE